MFMADNGQDDEKEDVTLSKILSSARSADESARIAESTGINEGVKFDTGKPRYDLIPADSLHELAKLYSMGAIKYGDRNWEKGMAWGRIFGAMMRHSWAWFRGEQFDPEDGQHHLASVAWCALALMSYEMRGIGTDDRP